VRPYVMRCAGTPVLMLFDIITRVFYLRFLHDPEITEAPTIVFVPLYQYPREPRVQISDGNYSYSPETQTLEFYHNASAGKVDMCCSVLQCVAVCCSVLQCVAVCSSVI